jgi:hypothetical protein
MKLGQDLAQLSAGIDFLYRRIPHSDGFLDQEGLIPVAVAKIEPLQLADFTHAGDELEAFATRVPQQAESALRRDYLLEMIDSLRMLIMNYSGFDIPFSERVQRQIRVETQMIDDNILDVYRAEIRENLDACGYSSGDLSRDVQQWEIDTTVPADKVLKTLNQFIKEARHKVSTMMFEMGGEWLEPIGINDVPFNAYCDYPDRKLILNVDLTYTQYMLKHLACHEAFPGHLVHLALRERNVADGRMPLDGAQVVTSSASSAIFEGIADNAIYFIDWINTHSDELGVVLNRLRAALRCNAAWMIHAQGKTPHEVAAMIAKAGFQDEKKVTNSLTFLSHKLREPFVYAYWCGDIAVHDIWKNLPKERAGEFWNYLYGNMHTPKTLAAHWDRRAL